MPIAFIAVFLLAIKEIIIWKRTTKLAKPFALETRKRQTGIIIKMIYSNTERKRAA
jgi:hypothetical protein